MAALAAHRPQQAHTVHPERIDFDDDHLHRTFTNSLAAAKPLTLAALLEQPIRFVEPRHALDDDKVPYTPINVKPTPKASPSKANGAPPSVNGSPVASTSKLPAAGTPANGSSKRLFPVVDTTAVWARPYKAGAGLRNLGNTCFLNSALQVLLHTPPLVRYLESQTQHGKTSCPVLERKGFCMICALRMCVKQSFTGNTPAYSPTPIVKNLRLIAKHFRLGRQEDSHEFLRFTVDALQAAALFGHPPKLDQKLKEQTFVHQLFGGRLCSRVHCQSCGHNSDTHDSILDLSLDLNGARSVKDALDNLVKLDHLKGQNKYKCEKCKKLVNAEKGFKIETAPVVLTVHLKRFTPTGRKAGQVISYHESLKLGGYMSSPDLNPSYKLYGVVLHSGGGPHSGHYTAYVRASNGNWYDMNDDYVRQVPTRQVLNDRDAYMLFYIRERGQALHDVINGAGPASQSSAQKANGNNKRPRESYPSPRVPNGVAASPSVGREGASTATTTTTAAVGSPVPRAGEPAPKRIRPTPVGVSDPTTALERGGAPTDGNAGASSPAVKVQFPFLPGAVESGTTSNGPTSSPSRPGTPAGANGVSSPAAAAASPKVKPFQSRTGQGVTFGNGSGPHGPTQPGSPVKVSVVGRLKPRKKKNRALVNGKGIQIANKPRVIEG